MVKITKNFIFNFGKHKGELATDVLKKDFQYILWCYKNIDWVEVSPELLNEARYKADTLKQHSHQTQSRCSYDDGNWDYAHEHDEGDLGFYGY